VNWTEGTPFFAWTKRVGWAWPDRRGEGWLKD
jgi:hypothetical protein